LRHICLSYVVKFGGHIRRFRRNQSKDQK